MVDKNLACFAARCWSMQQTMSKNLALRAPLQHRLSVRMRLAEIVLLTFVLLFGVALFAITLKEGLLQTVLLFIFVTIVGLCLAHSTAIKVGDLKLRILGSFWMIKIVATLIFLYLGWMPMLEMGSGEVGFDPQRYYHLSQELLANDWNHDSIGINYIGIIYFYAAIFFIFGVNPVIPALVNAFITFLCIIYIVRTAYAFVPYLNQKSHYIAWLVLIPEVLWYDVMTSRENLMAVFIVIVILGSGSVLNSVKKINVSGLALVLSAMFGIIVIRTSMILPVILSIVIIMFLKRSRSLLPLVLKFSLIPLGLVALMGGVTLHLMLGDYSFNFSNHLSLVYDFANNIASNSRMNWSDKSIGLLLVPNSLLEVMVFLPAKMILYLASPLPKIGVSLSGLVAGDYSQWLRLMTCLTSLLMLLGFPYVLAGSALAWRNRIEFPALLVIPIGFWVTFAAVVGGNIIINERYRLMVTLLLFTCIWLGFTQSRISSVIRWAALWYGLLAAAAVFYLCYKYL
jgi:hypothetical protein